MVRLSTSRVLVPEGSCPTEVLSLQPDYAKNDLPHSGDFRYFSAGKDLATGGT